MEETANIQNTSQPNEETLECAGEAAATMPCVNPAEKVQNFTVPVKFNKQTRELSLEEATQLAQKGLKFESIAPEYEKLKSLAVNAKQSIAEYLANIEKKNRDDYRTTLLNSCNSEQLAEKVIELELGKQSEYNLEELKREFPNINGIGDVPEAVLKSAELSGDSLLTAYLKFEHRQKLLAEESVRRQNECANASTGNIERFTAEDSSIADSEFLKGLWRK